MDFADWSWVFGFSAGIHQRGIGDGGEMEAKRRARRSSWRPFRLVAFSGHGGAGKSRARETKCGKPSETSGLTSFGSFYRMHMCMVLRRWRPQTSTVNNVAKSQLLCRIYAMANYTCWNIFFPLNCTFSQSRSYFTLYTYYRIRTLQHLNRWGHKLHHNQ